MVWLRIYNCLKSMIEENLNQELKLKNICERRNDFLKKNKANWIDEQKVQRGLHNSKLHWTLFYFSFYYYWIYFNFGSCFCVWYPYRNYDICNRIKIYAITAGIKKCKSIIEKRKNRHDEIQWLRKRRTNMIKYY